MAIRTLDQFDYHHILAQTPGVSLVYFTSPGCGACRQLKTMFENQQQEFGQIHLFEVDAQREMALTHEFGVFHLPALFLYHEGEFHAEIHAEPLPAAIMTAIEKALAAPAQEAP
jgi:thioredoxin 1